MKITIKATNLKLTPTLEDFTVEQINSLEKFLQKRIIEVFVEISKTTKHHKKGPFFRAEADLRVPGKIIRAEATGDDLYFVITAVKDELQIEIKKYKERQLAKQKRGARLAKRLLKVAPEAQTPADRDLGRRQLNEGI